MHAKPHTYDLIHHCLVNEIIIWMLGCIVFSMLFSTHTVWSFFAGGLTYCISQTAAAFYAFQYHKSGHGQLILKNFILGQLMKYALYIALLLAFHRFQPLIWPISLLTYLAFTLLRTVWLTRRGIYHGQS